jgi:tRNA1(Val) A37 N6-methylase TrmN6
MKPAELQMCRQILTKGDRVVEIGSGIGLLGIFATKRLGIENYFCVEGK